MKILVIGGTGLIGSKLVAILNARGHQAIAASPNTGVNTITGAGLAEALEGVQVVVDVANSPSFADDAVLEFFQTSGRNLIAAEKAADVRHHVALSVVGTDRLAQSGYFRGKIAQEKLIREGGIPYTIVHSTQFFEFLGGIVQSGTEGDVVRLPAANVQAIASDDVAQAVADATLAAPVNGIVEIAGPGKEPMAALVQRYLKATGDTRKVVADKQTRYFGAVLDDDTLTPGANAHLGKIAFEEWFRQSGQRP
ncbi:MULTISPECIES: SDR family oxidoreductase [unclassified Achromobacter]|uniref:SDR family oxidoreductase n=1 Tax=unclassified Achromobacter TaxID=2626865 RepID=UPI000B51CD53|nr:MULTISPECIES: SDR family oxidoreductase [unclassified Achromobacter]OWT73618.1 NmrA family transcriptional regulator [Achromobacter sp. HZ34]OWT79465.1 NmrA family transcriptional regulator [Achromobacter sp. HZ28]